MRSRGSSWEAPQHPPRMARAPRLPRPLTPRAGRPGHRPWSSLRAPDARRGPGAAARSPRRGGRGGARRGAGKATGPGRSRAAHPRSGAMAAPALRSARPPPHPAPPHPRRWPGETPALKVGAAPASEQWRRQRLPELRPPPPLGPGNSPPSLGPSPPRPAPELSRSSRIARPSGQRKPSLCSQTWAFIHSNHLSNGDGRWGGEGERQCFARAKKAGNHAG